MSYYNNSYYNNRYNNFNSRKRSSSMPPLYSKKCKLADYSRVEMEVRDCEGTPLVYFRNHQGRQFFTVTRDEFMDIILSAPKIQSYLDACKERTDSIIKPDQDSSESLEVLPRSRPEKKARRGSPSSSCERSDHD